MKPIIYVVADDEQVLDALQADLARRFANDRMAGASAQPPLLTSTTSFPTLARDSM